MISMKQSNILDLFRFKSFHGFAIHVGKMGLIFTVFYLVINPQIIQEWYISIHNHSESGLSLLNISQKQANANSGMHNDCMHVEHIETDHVNNGNTDFKHCGNKENPETSKEIPSK